MATIQQVYRALDTANKFDLSFDAQEIVKMVGQIACNDESNGPTDVKIELIIHYLNRIENPRP